MNKRNIWNVLFAAKTTSNTERSYAVGAKRRSLIAPWIKTLLISIVWLWFAGALTKNSDTVFYIVIAVGVIGVISSFFMARDHSPRFHRTMKHVK